MNPGNQSRDALSVDQLDRHAVSPGGCQCDWQPKTTADRVLTSHAEESLENAAEIFTRNSRPTVDDIHDHAGAVTRFVLVSRPADLSPPTGMDKTSLVAFIGDDHPGALLEVLTEFAVRGINLTWIESRPTGTGLGRYCFSIDCEGHIVDARVGEALTGLRRICADVRFLETSSCTPVLALVRDGISDADPRTPPQVPRQFCGCSRAG